jgi:hypothetical protein
MLDTNTVIKRKQTNEFAAQEQLRSAAARNRYPALRTSDVWCKHENYLLAYFSHKKMK